ncbi:beta strand repeat-containing protein, partial [Psychrobacter lutiphocae]
GEALEFTVSLTGGTSATDISVPVTYTGTATDGSDYTQTQTVVIKAGETSATLSVATNTDTVFNEGDETVIATLVDGDNYALGTATATGTIKDVVPPAEFTVTDATANEGSNLTFNVTVSKSGSITAPTLTDVTTTAADFSNKTPIYSGNVVDNGDGTLTATGDFTISYGTLADETTEGNETATLNLGDKTVTGTIIDTSLSKASILVTSNTDNSSETLDGVNKVYAVEDGSTGDLVYTVTLDNPVEIADGIEVKVKLSGTATGDDYVITSNGQQLTPVDNVVTLKFAKGQSTASFIVDPIDEPMDKETFGAEATIETVVATIDTSSGLVDKSAITGGQLEDTGSIIDSGVKALNQLTLDWSLKVGPTESIAASSGATQAGQFPEGVAFKGEKPMLLTDFNDKVYLGYYQNGNEASGYGNISALLYISAGANGKLTDGDSNTTTVDLAGGNDELIIKGVQGALTRVYFGEGNDTYVLNGVQNAYTFGEQGNDNFTFKSNVSGSVYMGSGSDTVKVAEELSGTLDLGSGNPMPSAYREFYQDGVTPLGGDNNIDLLTDENNVEIKLVTGSIIGGLGQDTITVSEYVQSGAKVNLGGGDDTLTARGLNNGSTIDMGAGDDTIKLTVMGEGLYSPSIDLGIGSDTLNLGTLNKGTINTGNDTDVDTVNITTMSGGTVNLGANDLMNLDNMSGGTVNLSAQDDVISIGDVIADAMSITNFSGGTINGGAGTDTLNVLGKDHTVNASNLVSIEKVDLGANGANDANTFIIGRAQMASEPANAIYVNGDASDKVQINGGYAKLIPSGSVTIDDTTYNQYATHSTMFDTAPRYVYVDADITKVVI